MTLQETKEYTLWLIGNIVGFLFMWFIGFEVIKLYIAPFIRSLL